MTAVRRPPGIRILDRYVFQHFVGSYALCFFFFVGLFLIVDFFNRIDAFLAARETIRESGLSVGGTLVRLYLYSIPFIFQQIGPFITLMAAMFTVTRLRKNNELFPMIHAGVSLGRVLLPVFSLAVLLAGAMLASQEYLIPRLAWKKNVLERLCEGAEPSLISDVETITDANGDRIRMDAFDAEQRRITGLDVTRFDRHEELRAEIAEYRGGRWHLDRGVVRAFDEQDETTPLVRVWDTDITPDDIRLATEDKSTLSFSQLREIRKRHPQRTQLLALMHHRLTFPLSNLVLLLLGLWAVLRLRQQSVFLGIALCMAICLGYFGVDFVAQALGQRGTLHPVLVAWLPTTLFGSLGVALWSGVRT